jgi:hypothetical protein
MNDKFTICYKNAARLAKECKKLFFLDKGNLVMARTAKLSQICRPVCGSDDKN